MLRKALQGLGDSQRPLTCVGAALNVEYSQHPRILGHTIDYNTPYLTTVSWELTRALK